MPIKSLSALLIDLAKKPKTMPDKDKLDAEIKELQLRMLQLQQALFHSQKRVVVIFEGFDAAGKGGTIRAITEKLDPRSLRVVAIAAPKKTDQGKHWLYRFWKKIPAPGEMTIFDRSWYGRVLVEKVEKLASEQRINDAYQEIREFEETLVRDGVILVKIFLAVTKDEQFKRFEERLQDPFKQWKITDDDIRARKNWHKYVAAVDKFLVANDTKKAPWDVVPSNSKRFARREALRILIKKLEPLAKDIQQANINKEQRRLLGELKNC